MTRWLKAKRLRFWVGCMDRCERWGITHWKIYYWFVARAVGCATWRFRGEQ